MDLKTTVICSGNIKNDSSFFFTGFPGLPGPSGIPDNFGKSHNSIVITLFIYIE